MGQYSENTKPTSDTDVCIWISKNTDNYIQKSLFCSVFQYLHGMWTSCNLNF